MSGPTVAVRPITGDDAAAAAAFLHRELNPRVSPEAWMGLFRPSWADNGPNHGFHLQTPDGTIVGVYAAVYSMRGGVAICNLAAFCVLEPYRAQGLRLIRTLLAQKGLVFTDLSPSGNVVAMNERLGFRRLDTSTRLLANIPGRVERGTRVTSDPATLAATLVGTDADVYRDHASTSAARHILVRRGDRYGYLVYRRDRRKRLRLFASPLYVGGDRDLVVDAWGRIRAHFLRRGLPFTLVEHRILGGVRGPGREITAPRAKMYRGEGVDPGAIDYLYSELALVEW